VAGRSVDRDRRDRSIAIDPCDKQLKLSGAAYQKKNKIRKVNDEKAGEQAEKARPLTEK